MIREELCSFKKKVWQELISKCVGEKKSIKALDLGTGPGFFAIIMSELGYTVTAIDCSDLMIDEAKENARVAGANIDFIKSDIENLNFPNEQFDLIVSRNVTWTLKEPKKAYENWYNLLKIGGKLVIFDANWYLRLSNPFFQEEYEKTQILLKSMGYTSKVSEKQKIECENIARKLPLTYEMRPVWDKEVLFDIGFNNVIINNDITEKIYTQTEKIAYKPTPMFCICGCK